MIKELQPGMHPAFKICNYPKDERDIIATLSKEWFITAGGLDISIGASSKYNFLLMKPVGPYKEMFNLEREIVVIFSPYEIFLPRTLDAIDFVTKRYQQLRIEKICSVVISRDDTIAEKLRDILKEDIESQIVIPFSYDELLKKIDSFFIRNRFKHHFYTRDLFAFHSPLRKDLYFFGRNDLVHSIVNRHRSNENSALFGLRKTGKTSIIYGIRRALSKIGEVSIFIDCESPAFHRRRWNKSLFYIISEIRSQLNLIIRLSTEDQYDEVSAPILFEKDLIRIYEKINKKSILIIFDEIENITFKISPSNHWSNEFDFIFFWQTLRSLFHKLESVFSYMIVGTNPMCIETPTILGKDNPIFNQVPYEYIPGFDVPQTRDMIRKLGRSMGLKFDEIIYSKLTEDYGGHPFLMRHVCSVINKISSKERPTIVDKSLYEKAKEIFNREFQSYIELLISVLKQFYSDEYAMLEYLACEDYITFKDLAAYDSYYVIHLLGYGIIGTNQNEYYFNIESLKQYLNKKKQYTKLNLSNEEMLKEISERRNAIEPKLRLIVRNQLLAAYGKINATEKVLDILGGSRKSKCSVCSYAELFDPNISNIYFEDIRKLVYTNWDCFKNIFPEDKDEFTNRMKVINKYRVDAHAKTINTDDMQYFRVCMKAIEKHIDKFLL